MLLPRLVLHHFKSIITSVRNKHNNYKHKHKHNKSNHRDDDELCWYSSLYPPDAKVTARYHRRRHINHQHHQHEQQRRRDHPQKQQLPSLQPNNITTKRPPYCRFLLLILVIVTTIGSMVLSPSSNTTTTNPLSSIMSSFVVHPLLTPPLPLSPSKSYRKRARPLVMYCRFGDDNLFFDSVSVSVVSSSSSSSSSSVSSRVDCRAITTTVRGENEHNSQNNTNHRDSKLSVHTKSQNNNNNENKSHKNFNNDECDSEQPKTLTTFPTCNKIHEIPLKDQVMFDTTTRLVSNGYWRDVWRIRSSSSFPTFTSNTTTSSSLSYFVALKTLRYRHTTYPTIQIYHAKDAFVSTLGSSNSTPTKTMTTPLFPPVYSYCADTLLTQYLPGGTLSERLWPATGNCDLSLVERLEVGWEVGMSVAELHSLGVVHTDVTPDQFLWLGGRYRLNDFNRCHILHRRRQRRRQRSEDVEDEWCQFTTENNAGTFRSPEEYTPHAKLTQKIDVYQLGSVLYNLLTLLWPFEEYIRSGESETVRRIIQKGGRPNFSSSSSSITITNGSDRNSGSISERRQTADERSELALRTAIDRCWRHDPKERPTASEVTEFLGRELDVVIGMMN